LAGTGVILTQFSWLSLAVPDKCQDSISNPVMTTPFHNLSNSLFTDHPKYLTNVSGSSVLHATLLFKSYYAYIMRLLNLFKNYVVHYMF
jgi:hypothetical protein